jgi:hypothetical protein
VCGIENSRKVLEAHPTSPDQTSWLRCKDFGLERRRGPCMNQFTPITRFSSRGKIMISKSPDAIVGDSFCFFRMGDQVLDFLLEVGEIPFDLDEVLVGAIGNKKIVMMLNPLHFVNDDNRIADLSIFQRSRIASTCKKFQDQSRSQNVLSMRLPSACTMNMYLH